MSEKTYIKGKDLDLETSIATMQDRLSSFGFNVEEASWINPVTNCYSVHLKDKDCEQLFTNGKGASAKSALASALGEFLERLSNNLFFADFYLGDTVANQEFVHYPSEKWFVPIDETINGKPEGLMNESLWGYFDPNKELTTENLFDFNSGFGERGICALPFVNLKTSEQVFIPVSIIANIFVSNGMSAGNTKYEAQGQALSEILERFVKNKIIAEELCLPEIPQDELGKFPAIMASCGELEENGFSLRIADASLGGKYPVVSVTLINPQNGTVFSSYGAHPSFEVAFERTVTELLQGRKLNQLNGFESPSFESEEIASLENIEAHFINSTGLISYEFFKDKPDFEYVDWNQNLDTENECKYLLKIIEDDGFDAYIMEYGHLNTYSCRILVPGMSDIYPVEDLVWDNNNEGGEFREAILNLNSLNGDALTNLLDGLEDGQYSDEIKVIQFLGLIADEGSLWVDLCLGELKTMISLALQKDDVLNWVKWCTHQNHLTDEVAKQYKCLLAILEINEKNKELSTFRASLDLLFGKDLVSLCVDMINGKRAFEGLFFSGIESSANVSSGLELEGFKDHQKLIKSYQKLAVAKSNNWK